MYYSIKSSIHPCACFRTVNIKYHIILCVPCGYNHQIIPLICYGSTCIITENRSHRIVISAGIRSECRRILLFISAVPYIYPVIYIATTVIDSRIDEYSRKTTDIRALIKFGINIFFIDFIFVITEDETKITVETKNDNTDVKIVDGEESYSGKITKRGMAAFFSHIITGKKNAEKA